MDRFVFVVTALSVVPSAVACGQSTIAQVKQVSRATGRPILAVAGRET